MATLDMGKRRYELIVERIEQFVNSNTPGNFALGYVNDEKKFVIRFVGRDDVDLAGRLKKLALEKLEKCETFKFSYATTKNEAFQKECQNYHDFGGSRKKLLNEKHPDRPQNSKYYCEICGGPHED